MICCDGDVGAIGIALLSTFVASRTDLHDAEWFVLLALMKMNEMI